MLRAAIWIIFLVTFVAGNGPFAFAEKRVALVIGNSAYHHTARLQTPRNDAADIAAVLKRMRFTVIEGKDLDKRGMEQRIRDFALALEGADVGLFFYAGHGLHVDGKNFLAPVEAALKSERDLDFEAVRLDLILRQLERHTRLGLVFLDACRDNPMATTLARSLKARGRSVSVGRGLARVEKVVGMMIAFATQPGSVAMDSKGRNSPFTKALLGNFESEGTTIGDVMIQVRNDVIAATDGKQVPWENSSLTGKFYFKPTAAAEPRVAAYKRDLSDDSPTIMVDHTFWTSIRDSNNPVLYRQYLERFPGGAFVPIARDRLGRLRGIEGKQEGAATTSVPSTETIQQAGLQQDGHGAVVDLGRRQASINREVAGLQLVLETQRVLKLMSCYSGKIDGKWGRGSRAAMRRFNRGAGLDLPLEPNAASLDVIKSEHSSKGHLCSLTTKQQAEPRDRAKSAKRRARAKKARRNVSTRRPRSLHRFGNFRTMRRSRFIRRR